MPTYDYQCDACGHTFEAFQSMKDDALQTCPQCSENALRRLISGGTGIIFKGSGFYVNDSKGGSGSAPKGSQKSEAPAETAASGAAKSDGDTASTTTEKKSAEAKSSGGGEKKTA